MKVNRNLKSTECLKLIERSMSFKCLRWLSSTLRRLRPPGRALPRPCASPLPPMPRSVHRCARKAIAFAATGLYNATKEDDTFNWETCHIDVDILKNLTKEMTVIDNLKSSTLTCNGCRKRLIIDKTVPDQLYCGCNTNRATSDEDSGWQPYLEKPDIIIWRRDEGEGLYAYKVYGKYPEISAEDFLAMHVDTEYWRSWDSTAIQVELLEKQEHRYGGQCVIYWEALWPRFFANRDYVYVRRYAYMSPESDTTPQQNGRHNGSDRDKERGQMDGDREGQLLVMVSKSCVHPEAPETSKAYRVTHYWSNLVVKPFTTPDEAGMEFSLTYFDDPGVSFPPALQAWVAGQACPDFLMRMRSAANNYKKKKQEAQAEKKNIGLKHIEGSILTKLQQGQPAFNMDYPVPIPKKVIVPICEPIPWKNKKMDPITDKRNDTQEFMDILMNNVSKNCQKTDNKQAIKKKITKYKDSVLKTVDGIKKEMAQVNVVKNTVKGAKDQGVTSDRKCEVIFIEKNEESKKEGSFVDDKNIQESLKKESIDKNETFVKVKENKEENGDEAFMVLIGEKNETENAEDEIKNSVKVENVVFKITDNVSMNVCDDKADSEFKLDVIEAKEGCDKNDGTNAEAMDRTGGISQGSNLGYWGFWPLYYFA